MNNKKNEEIDGDLSALLDYVRVCRGRVGKGEDVDLRGFENRVKSICDEILSLPQEHRSSLEGRMEQLIEGLEDLAKDMRERLQKNG